MCKFENMVSLNQLLTFEVAKKYFRKVKIELNTQLMEEMGLVTDEGIYTNMALLLSDQCEHKVKVTIFDGDLVKERREFNGSVLKQLTEAYEFILSHTKTKTYFNDMNYVEKKDYSPKSIREALVNALVHRDYLFSGCTLVNFLVDRIEFISLGGLVNGLTKSDILLGVSQSRNARLAECLYNLKIIEVFGSGIKNIYGCYQNSILQPEIKVSENAFSIILPNNNYSQSTQICATKENAVLDHINRYSYITRSKAQTILNISQSMAGRLLKEMVEAEVLKMVGRGPSCRYIKKIDI